MAVQKTNKQDIQNSSSMINKNTNNNNFEITVKVKYIESESRPEQNYHFFSYKVFIKNNSTTTSQLISRHWIITDGSGAIEEVRGPGVIGLQPKIKPGEIFEYESACPLSTAQGSMKGSYQMVSDMGETFNISIPEFYLIAPTSLH